MKTIQLSGRKHNDKKMIVDSSWYEMLKYVKILYRNGYASFTRVENGVLKHEFIHQVIMDFKSNKEMCIDHINMNKLDNRTSNLRIVPHSINNSNRKNPNKNNKTGIRNLSFENGYYVVKFMENKKLVYCKSFKNKEDAINNLESFKHFRHRETTLQS